MPARTTFPANYKTKSRSDQKILPRQMNYQKFLTRLSRPIAKGAFEWTLQENCPAYNCCLEFLLFNASIPCRLCQGFFHFPKRKTATCRGLITPTEFNNLRKTDNRKGRSVWVFATEHISQFAKHAKICQKLSRFHKRYPYFCLYCNTILETHYR